MYNNKQVYYIPESNKYLYKKDQILRLYTKKPFSHCKIWHPFATLKYDNEVHEQT